MGKQELKTKMILKHEPVPPLHRWVTLLLGQVRQRLSRADSSRPRLALLERISLAPRQSLALIEAEGRLLLIATSADGGPAFYPLDRPLDRLARPAAQRNAARVSW